MTQGETWENSFDWYIVQIDMTSNKETVFIWEKTSRRAVLGTGPFSPRQLYPT